MRVIIATICHNQNYYLYQDKVLLDTVIIYKQYLIQKIAKANA